MSGMRSANERDQSTDRRTTAYSTERQGEGAARAAYPRPDDRLRPPSAPGVLVPACAQAACGARGRRLSGPTGTDSDFYPQRRHPLKPTGTLSTRLPLALIP